MSQSFILYASTEVDIYNLTFSQVYLALTRQACPRPTDTKKRATIFAFPLIHIIGKATEFLFFLLAKKKRIRSLQFEDVKQQYSKND